MQNEDNRGAPTDSDAPLVTAALGELERMGIAEPERTVIRDAPEVVRKRGGWVRIVLHALRAAGATVTMTQGTGEAEPARALEQATDSVRHSPAGSMSEAEPVAASDRAKHDRRKELRTLSDVVPAEDRHDEEFVDAPTGRERAATPAERLAALDARVEHVHRRLAQVERARQLPVVISLDHVEVLLTVADGLEPSLGGYLDDVALMCAQRIREEEGQAAMRAFHATPEEMGQSAVQHAALQKAVREGIAQADRGEIVEGREALQRVRLRRAARTPRLARAAAAAALGLLEVWKLDDETGERLLGLAAGDVPRWRAVEPRALPVDVMQRASLLIGVHAALARLFLGEGRRTAVRLRQPIAAFGGRSMLDYMLADGVTAMRAVREWLEREGGV